MSNAMEHLFTAALNDQFARPILKVDLGANARDVRTYLRGLNIPPISQVIVWSIRDDQVWFIGDAEALSRIQRDRARVVSSTVTQRGAIVETLANTCSCPGEMLERGRHLSGCADGPPVFIRATAPIEDFTCSICPSDVPVVFTEDWVPSRQNRKVRCAAGHVTNGIPVARYRL